MHRAALPFLLGAVECGAHPGHGAALAHSHGWDWPGSGFWILAAVVAAVIAWRAKQK